MDTIGDTDDTDDTDGQIQATVVSYDDQPDQCTLHPVQPDERCRTTEWITADENSYVTLAQWR
jgi:hypothetical protein